jgi:hypothetical protein
MYGRFLLDRYCRCWKSRCVGPNASSVRAPERGFRHARRGGRVAGYRFRAGSASMNPLYPKSFVAGPERDSKSPNQAKFGGPSAAATTPRRRYAPTREFVGGRFPFAMRVARLCPIHVVRRAEDALGRWNTTLFARTCVFCQQRSQSDDQKCWLIL